MESSRSPRSPQASPSASASSPPTGRPSHPMAIAAVLQVMSPPDHTPYESFSQSPIPPQKPKSAGSPAQQAATPPVSPWTAASNQPMAQQGDHDTKDPILFEAPGSPAQALFAPSTSRPCVTDGDISRHMAARQLRPLRFGIQTPTAPEYAQFAAFTEILWQRSYDELKTDEERRHAVRALREQNRFDQRARSAYLASLKAKPAPRKPQPLAAKPAHSSSSGPSTSSLVASATRPHHVTKVTKVTKRPTVSRSGRTSIAPSRLGSPPPVPSKPAPKLRRAKTGKPQTLDKAWEHIPDYCPPLSSLDDTDMEMPPNASLKDFSDEDKRYLHLLHPVEQHLVRSVVLPVAKYLTVKRRIFVDRLYFYHFEKEQQEKLAMQGKKETQFVKNFGKTHAQDACKMDVNKASKLHTAFESVGWLDKKWMERYPKPTFDNRLDKHFTEADVAKHGPPGPQKNFKRGV